MLEALAEFAALRNPARRQWSRTAMQSQQRRRATALPQEAGRIRSGVELIGSFDLLNHF
ncbi:hypothetical protein [Neorhizobium tomejilense]|uniref:hypothetical protein n=1 Tax=Neorhizobium tomejilense TaxID=2093828 RepID=UPI00155F079D|nr:hypothetical protein [Neorhizobium tomejilense]